MSAVKVHLYDDSTLKASPVVSGGLWSQASVSLTAGMHILKAKAEDAAGNLSGFSAVKKVFTGSTTKPVCWLLDDTGLNAYDNITNDSTPRIKVKLQLNSERSTLGTDDVSANSVSALKIYKKTGTSTYSLLGTYTENLKTPDVIVTFEAIHQIETALDDGNHEFCASWVDAQGNESAKGTILTITIDTQAPDAPAITNIQDGQVFVGTSIDVSGTAS